MNVITSGATSGGDNSRGRKRHAERASQASEPPKALQASEPHALVFFNQDLEGLTTPHDDALVISATINYWNVDRILVDNGSAPDVLSYECFLKMGENPSKFHPIQTPLCGFNGQATYLEGALSLPFTLRTPPKIVTVMVDFIVIKGMSAYNAIFGRGILSQMKVVPSTYH